MGGEGRQVGPLACFPFPFDISLSPKPISSIIYQNEWFLGGVSEEVGIPASWR